MFPPGGGTFATRSRVAEFLRAKKLDLPVLLDAGKETFAAFHNPGLPSLVIVKAEVLELLAM